MNIAYFRKTNKDLETVTKDLKKAATDLGLMVQSEVGLNRPKGTVFNMCKPEWMERLVGESHELVGLMPCSVLVFEHKDGLMVGAGKPSIMASLTQNREITSISAEAEKALTELIHQAAGVEALKPSGVTLYSTTTCPYCKMEEAWLKEKGIEYEMVLVDLNQAKAQELVEKTGQMGVPVTEIQYEDADPEYIVGFDREKLSTILVNSNEQAPNHK